MATATVAKEMDVSADALWALVEDFGNASWLPAGTEVTLEGEGVGMVRVMGGAIREKLEACDPATKTLSYSIEDEGVPFPVTGYYATMVVEDLGSGSSRLTWSCKAEPKGDATDESVKAQIEGMYDMMCGWMHDAVKSA